VLRNGIHPTSRRLFAVRQPHFDLLVHKYQFTGQYVRQNFARRATIRAEVAGSLRTSKNVFQGKEDMLVIIKPDSVEEGQLDAYLTRQVQWSRTKSAAAVVGQRSLGIPCSKWVWR